MTTEHAAPTAAPVTITGRASAQPVTRYPWDEAAAVLSAIIVLGHSRDTGGATYRVTIVPDGNRSPGWQVDRWGPMGWARVYDCVRAATDTDAAMTAHRVVGAYRPPFNHALVPIGDVTVYADGHAETARADADQ